VQYRKQRRIHNEGLGVADELSDDLPAQGLKETPELPHPALQRGRMKPHHPGEQMREEPLGIAQERALALHASQLLEKGEGDDFRVREALYGFVAAGTGVEMGVSVVDEAKEHREGLFRMGEAWGMVGLGHLLLLGEGRL
jgi:hypothetical protein